MKLSTKALVLLIWLAVICSGAGVWAEEAPPPATPEEVVEQFGELMTPAMMGDRRGRERLNPLLSEQSVRALEEAGDSLLEPLLMCLMFPRLQAQGSRIEGDTATVEALPVKRPLKVKLVKEDGQWKIDLVATLEDLPESFRRPLTQAKDRALATASLSNVKQIVLAVLIYAQDHDEHLPPADKWIDEIMPYVRNEQLFRCPAAPDLEYGYAFNAGLNAVKMEDITRPSEIVLIFESNLGTRNAAGGPEAVSDPPRHDVGNAYGFVDGHVKLSPDVPDFGPEGLVGAPVLREVTAENFQAEVLQAKEAVLVDFWSPLSGPCKALKPILREVAAEYVDQVKFCSLNVDEAEEIAHRYNVHALPCLVMFREGKAQARLIGLPSDTQLKSWIDRHR